MVGIINPIVALTVLILKISISLVLQVLVLIVQAARSAAEHRHATDALCRRDFTNWWYIKRGGFGQVRANPTGRG